jgi:hypothetical protein
MAGFLATAAESLFTRLLPRFSDFDRDRDGLITQSDLYQLMQDRSLQGADAAAVAALRGACPRRGLSKEVLCEWSQSNSEAGWNLQQVYQGAVELLTAPDLNRSLYRTGNAPCWRDIHQGYLEDCWFVAAVIGLARHRPRELERMVQPNGDGSHDVTFPGGETIRGVFVTDAEIAAYRVGVHRCDGLLLPVLEKAYGRLLRPSSVAPFEVINAGTARAGKGLRLLTGHGSRLAYLCRGPFGWWQRVVKRLIVPALTADPPRVVIVSDTNFWHGHLWAVVEYHAADETLALQDPRGGEPRGPMSFDSWVREFTFVFVEMV